MSRTSRGHQAVGAGDLWGPGPKGRGTGWGGQPGLALSCGVAAAGHPRDLSVDLWGARGDLGGSMRGTGLE